MAINNELFVEITHPKEDLVLDGDSRNYYLEYELDSERVGDGFSTLYGTPLITMTRSQKGKTMTSSS
jgi:hypothetical protein